MFSTPLFVTKSVYDRTASSYLEAAVTTTSLPFSTPLLDECTTTAVDDEVSIASTVRNMVIVATLLIVVLIIFLITLVVVLAIILQRKRRKRAIKEEQGDNAKIIGMKTINFNEIASCL